jgi:hypothetical protein
MIFSTKGKLKLSPFAAYPDNQFGQLKKIYKKKRIYCPTKLFWTATVFQKNKLAKFPSNPLIFIATYTNVSIWNTIYHYFP